MPVHLLVWVPLLAVLMAGCGGDDSTGPGGDGNGNGAASAGVLTFNYSGSMSGSYSANGTAKATYEESLATGSFAVATRIQGRGMGVTAFRRTSGTRGDMVIVVLEGEGTGRYDAAPSSCGSRCATVMIYFDVDYTKGQQSYGRAFAFETGEVQVSESTSSVLKGTFSGRAVELFGEGGEFSVTNGNFSAPVVVSAPAMASANVVPLPVLAGLDPTRAEGFDRLSPAGQERLLAYVGAGAAAR